jgi:peptidoglycan/LPS O-acetylase OafA/YrhL
MSEGAPPSAPVAPEPAVSDSPVPMSSSSSRFRVGQSTILGGLLVLIGVILLAGQVVHLDLGHYGWPFFIIVPGVALLVVALASRGVIGEGLAIAGSIVTVSGLILLYQNATDHFESWSYAWALVVPGAVGSGMILYGLAAGRPGNVRAGSRLVAIGVVLFLLGAAFFEGVLGIGGYSVGRSTGAIVGAVIIALGALLLVANLISGRRNPR